jgi:hypothetical protein
MKYYKDQDGNVYAYENAAEKNAFGPAGLTAMTAAQVEAHNNPPKTAEQIEVEAREAFKAQREVAVAAITITTAAGNVFDGDEVSQGRMARAIIGLSATGDPATTITWILADNTPVLVTAAELTEAMVLSGNAQSALWVQAPVVEEPTPEAVAEPGVEEPLPGA